MGDILVKQWLFLSRIVNRVLFTVVHTLSPTNGDLLGF